MLSVLYAEINIFCIMIVSLILRRVIIGVNAKHHRNMLIHMIVSSIMSFTFDLLWVLVDIGTLQVSNGINYLINACYFLSTGALSYFWYIYVRNVLDPEKTGKKVFVRLSRIPLLVYAILLVLSYWTGWIFYIAEDGSYHRGSLYGLQMFISYGYVVYATIKVLIKASDKRNWTKRPQYRMLIIFAIFPFVFGMAQIIIEGVPLISAGITLAILCFYLNYQEQQISLDTLTQLNNRRQLIAYLENKVKHQDRERTLYLLMLDMDYFKKINDQYGHVEGDNALVRVAGVLRSASRNSNCFLSRYGGDEFTIVYEATKPEDIEAFCARIRECLSIANDEAGTPYRLSLSIGYAAYSREYHTLQDFIRAADQELYKVKKARK